jgi:hypothetical protein
MRLLSLFAVAMAGLIAMPALAQTPTPDGTPTRVRGTVEKDSVLGSMRQNQAVRDYTLV